MNKFEQGQKVWVAAEVIEVRAKGNVLLRTYFNDLDSETAIPALEVYSAETISTVPPMSEEDRAFITAAENYAATPSHETDQSLLAAHKARKAKQKPPTTFEKVKEVVKEWAGEGWLDDDEIEKFSRNVADIIDNAKQGDQ